MAKVKTNASDTADRELVMSRLLNAPRELVWKAWTDPQHVIHWWGPDGFTNSIHEMQVKPGGVWRFMMHGPDGTDFPNKIIFQEVQPPEKLVYTHSSEDENDPGRFYTTVTFEERGTKTFLTMKAVFASAEELQRVINEYGAKEGGNQTLRRLDEYLLNTMSSPVVLERVYAANAGLIWKALTDPAEMKKWYFDVPDFRPEPGVEFHFLAGDKEKEYLHLCRVTEVIPGKKIAYTWRYDGYTGDSEVSFELFTEGDHTRLRIVHKRLDSFPDDPAFAKGNFTIGWTHFLDKSLPGYLLDL